MYLLYIVVYRVIFPSFPNPLETLGIPRYMLTFLP